MRKIAFFLILLLFSFGCINLWQEKTTTNNTTIVEEQSEPQQEITNTTYKPKRPDFFNKFDNIKEKEIIEDQEQDVSINILLTPKIIEQGDLAILTWQITGDSIDKIELTNEGEISRIGKLILKPDETTSYTFIIYLTNGDQLTRTLTLKVLPKRTTIPLINNTTSSTGCTNYYLDKDKDGYGTSLFKCLSAPTGDFTALQSGDCDDKDNSTYPGAEEQWDGYDHNCNGQYDDSADLQWIKELDIGLYGYIINYKYGSQDRYQGMISWSDILYPEGDADGIYYCLNATDFGAAETFKVLGTVNFTLRKLEGSEDYLTEYRDYEYCIDACLTENKEERCSSFETKCVKPGKTAIIRFEDTGSGISSFNRCIYSKIYAKEQIIPSEVYDLKLKLNYEKQ